MLTQTPAFNSFLDAIRAKRLAHYKSGGYTFATPTVEIEIGAKFAKVYFQEIHTGATAPSNRGSVVAFIALCDFSNRQLGEVKTGDIFKSASYKAPAKHARGNVLAADNGLTNWGDYGPNYLRE